MKRIAAFFLFAAALTLTPLCAATAQDTSAPAAPATTPEAEKIGLDDFLALVKQNPAIQIFDVRAEDFRRIVRFKDTANIPINDLERRIGEIDLSRPLILYCQTGVTSANAAKMILAKNPSAKIYDLEGGLAASIAFLSTEPDTVAAVPAKKAAFDALRALIVAPDIAVVGINFPLYRFGDGKGNILNVSKLKGKSAILAFFDASDLKQFDAVAAMKTSFDKKKLKGFAFVPVAITQPGTTAKQVLAYAKKKKWAGPLWFDAGGLAATQMRLTGLPNFNMIDSKGVLRIQDISDTSEPIDYYRDNTFEDMVRIMTTGKLPPFPLSRDELTELRQTRMTGKPAPDFTLNDTSGAPHSILAAASKNGAIVIFGSLHCPYTVQELKTAATCSDIPVLAVLPSFNESDPNEPKQFIEKENIPYPFLIDPSGDAFGKYYVSSIPSWWVISKDGTIVHQETGYSQTICETAKQALAK